MKIEGVWLPIITPFLKDSIDFVSYRKCIDHYINQEISGLIPLGTTGESPTIEEKEFEEIIEKTMEYVAGRVPVFVGVGGNNTKKVIEKLSSLENKIDGILSVAPYYNRPSQRGIYEHFYAIAQSTDLPILLYNIPYRTGRNIENETIYKLAEIKNIAGLKDACGDIKQSMSLLLNPPSDFSILTGEDILYYSTLTLGGDGAILASAHIETTLFIQLYNYIRANNHVAALEIWKKLSKFIPLLFEEPNPAPIKYILKKQGWIESDEVRLPLTSISNKLAEKLNVIL